MGTPLIWVDAFTDTPMHGNPAAICLLDGPADKEWMQRLAFELDGYLTVTLRRGSGEP